MTQKELGPWPRHNNNRSISNSSSHASSLGIETNEPCFGICLSSPLPIKYFAFAYLLSGN